MDEVQQGLRYVFQTDSPYTLCVSGTGHAGMEAAIANLVEPGETVVVGNKGIWVSAQAARKHGPARFGMMAKLLIPALMS
jgi:aspartate aminotransferase-like enzyme